MKLATVIILYYPDCDLLRKNLEIYISFSDVLIIWDNTPGGTLNISKIVEESESQRIVIMGDGLNHLISYPLNQILDWSMVNRCNYVLTMDQDSTFIDSSIVHIKEHIKQIVEKDCNASIFGINPNNLVDCNLDPHVVPDVITSGTIYDIEKMHKIGGFREDYGIDAVDIEICYRASKFGLRTYILPSIRLNQQYGSGSKTWLGFRTLNYSPFRCYHISRNFTRLRIEYPKTFAQHKFFYRTFLLIGVAKILLCESQKIPKIKSILLGIYDGVLNKTKRKCI